MLRLRFTSHPLPQASDSLKGVQKGFKELKQSGFLLHRTVGTEEA